MPPSALVETLQAIRRKMKVYAVALGAGRVVAIAAALLVALVFVDWAANWTTLVPGGLPGSARIVLLLTALTVLAISIGYWIARPSLVRYSVSDVAGWVEERFPNFGDSLRSTVDFLRTDIPGSQVMKERVVTQAVEKLQGSNLNEVIDPRPVWYSSGTALAAIGLVIGLGVVAGSNFREIAASRLFNPFGGKAWPKSVEMSPGAVPVRVAVGDPVPVRVTLTKGDKPSRKVLIRYRYDNGPWQEETMERQGGNNGVYTANLDTRLDQAKASGTMQVQLESGDDEKVLPAITIVPRLDVSAVEADVTPPTYVQPNEPSKVNLNERPAVMAVGSSVAVQLRFNKPLADKVPVVLQPTKTDLKLPAIKWERPTPNIAIARFNAGDSFRFTVHATDTDNFTNTGAAEYELIVREDQNPTVQIEEPRRSEERTAIAQFLLKAVAEDDYGVLGAQLVVQRLGEKAPTTQPAEQPPQGPAAPAVAPASAANNRWVIDLVKDGKPAIEGASWQQAGGTIERKRFELAYDWDLAKLENANLKPGDVLEYFVQVRDNYNLNGKQHPWVGSGKLRITIISQEQLATRMQQAFETLHNQLKEVHTAQIRNKQEAELLRQMTEKKPAFDEADKQQADRIASQESMSASQTQQAAQKLQAMAQTLKENKSPDESLKQTADDVQKQLENTAEGAMKEAAKNLNDAREQKADPKASAQQKAQQAKDRNDALAKASEDQQQAADQIQKAMDRLGNFDGLSEFRRKAEDIAAQQKKLEDKFNKSTKGELGKKWDELSEEKKNELKKQADEQAELSKKTQDMLDKMTKKADQMEKSDPASSQAMKAASRTGNEQQVPGKQSQASQSMQQNQQAQAQQAQKQAELGLEMIISKLKEAERRKLEELQAKLAEIQKLVNDLVARQAGHNIDNLLMQGGDKLRKMDSNDRTALYENAGRDDKTPASATTVRDLRGAQITTEKNTRDVAKQAESLPDSTPSSKLTVAAGHMERAIVHLGNEKLADAYDPPQVEALAALVSAREAVAAALKKVQDQLQEKDKETIRQAYVRILALQKKIGQEIVDIDATPKDNGDLPRPVAVRLGQLPPDQGKLADDVNKLGDDLEKLGSVVYKWANTDIVETMKEVKDDLAKPDTGKSTQAEEQRIEDQLQAMIESLAVKPKKSDFANKNNGGQGQGTPKKKMPGEAELRLLKALQQAVNKSTKTIDEQKDKDKEKLLALGGRQGSLRDLLDKMVKKASGDGLGPEPDNKDQLPEEATKEQVDDQEFVDQLLKGKATDDAGEKGIKLTGVRMARSRQRLAINDDPGQVTQEIQKRILKDLDDLIEMARAQQAQSKPSPGQKPGDKMKGPQPGEQQGQQQANQNQQHRETGSTPAQQSTMTQGSDPQADLSQDIKEKLQEWGRLHPRDRQPLIEAAKERTNPKYQKLVEDYYKSLAEKATEQR